jgi:hypothetical protein
MHHAPPYLGSKPNNHNKGILTAQWKQSSSDYILGIVHKVALTLFSPLPSLSLSLSALSGREVNTKPVSSLLLFISFLSENPQLGYFSEGCSYVLPLTSIRVFP